MTDPVNVFVLAAGMGERLRPVTNVIPKPLIPVLGKTVLERVLDGLTKINYQSIGINLHYQADMISEWIRSTSFGSDMSIFLEPLILGTGGGLKNAEGFLKKGTFVVHNADLIHDFDLTKLIAFHKSTDNICTLAVIDHPPVNSVHIGPDGLLLKVGRSDESVKKGTKKRTFTGIAVYEPEFLEYLFPGVSSVVDAWSKVIGAGKGIGCYDYQGGFWSDIGTPSSYVRTVMKLLHDEGETIYLHPSVDTCGMVELGGRAVIESGVLFEGESYIKDCIILPDTIIKEGSSFQYCITGNELVLNIAEREFITINPDTGYEVIGSGGSDREYFRVPEEAGSTVMLRSGEYDEDFVRQIEYSRFFKKSGFPVPELISADMDRREAVFEDLGDMSLYAWLKCPRPEREVCSKYERALDHLVSLHADVTEHVHECSLLEERTFDRDYFRWETRYFQERFLRDHYDLDRTGDTDLNTELDRMAEKASSFARAIIHRDCQSQNIMITRDGRISFIDYQGARMGPPAYDIASLLWDPYAPISVDMRNELLSLYMEGVQKRKGGNLNRGLFESSLMICRSQRHMQALGAYAFLSNVKGKHYFLKFIPEGIQLLKEDRSGLGDEFPHLSVLIDML